MVIHKILGPGPPQEWGKTPQRKPILNTGQMPTTLSQLNEARATTSITARLCTSVNLAFFWKLLKVYILNSGPDYPRNPQHRPEMLGTGGPGPPKNSPTVEPRIKSTKSATHVVRNPNVHDTHVCVSLSTEYPQPQRRLTTRRFEPWSPSKYCRVTSRWAQLTTHVHNPS
jgi:hypothetical protein